MSKVKQHTVPKFYLKQFVPDGEDHVLYRYGLDGANAERVSCRKATTEDHFYSLSREDGTWDTTLEDSLGKIETKVAPMLKRLLDGRTPTVDDRVGIAFFIALMLYRVTAMRDRAQFEASRILDPDVTLKYLATNRERLIREYSVEEVEEYERRVRENGRGIDLPRNFHFIDLDRRLQPVAVGIARMSWTIESVKGGQFFITSDNPAYVRRRGHPRDPGPVGFGRGDLHAEMYFPLSHRSLLVARHVGDATSVRRSQVSPTRVLQLNKLTVLMAHTDVFSPYRSELVEDLVEECGAFQVEYPQLPLERTGR